MSNTMTYNILYTKVNVPVEHRDILSISYISMSCSDICNNYLNKYINIKGPYSG